MYKVNRSNKVKVIAYYNSTKSSRFKNREDLVESWPINHYPGSP